MIIQSDKHHLTKGNFTWKYQTPDQTQEATDAPKKTKYSHPLENHTELRQQTITFTFYNEHNITYNNTQCKLNGKQTHHFITIPGDHNTQQSQQLNSTR